jgi:uncharacterized protein YraI
VSPRASLDSFGEQKISCPYWDKKPRQSTLWPDGTRNPDSPPCGQMGKETQTVHPVARWDKKPRQSTLWPDGTRNPDSPPCGQIGQETQTVHPVATWDKKPRQSTLWPDGISTVLS